MKIVLAVDGSDQSYFAARSLEHLAKMEKVIVLQALDVPQPAFPMMVPEVANELDQIAERKLREEGERVLKFVGSVLPPHTGPVTKRMEVGKPAEMILSVAEEEKADLIVLGSRGLGPVKELLLGSVSHRVVSHAPCPTLVVNRPLRSIRRVMLAVQGPEDAARLTMFLAGKPFREPVEIAVYTVAPVAQPLLPPGPSKLDELIEKTLAAGRAFVEGVAAELSAHQYRTKGGILMGPPALAILQEAASSEPDLLLMGSHGRKVVTRFLLGSVSHAVLHRAPCPVLIVR